MELLNGKRAVITGGSEGIGFAIAKRFIENGAAVLLIGRDREKLGLAHKKLTVNGNQVLTMPFDLAEVSKINALVKSITKVWPKVDVLVNNAAVAYFEPVEAVNLSKLEHIFKVNVKAPYLLSQELLPSLIETEGSIINISSYFSDRMVAGRPSTAYSLTKGAINSFTKALACEVGPKKVRVNAIAPGSVHTPMLENALQKMSDQQRLQFQQNIQKIYPLQRLGNPDDIANVALFLASDLSGWITGAVINADGGLRTN
ncbi:MAG: SDR family oxidoreductase [Bacteroidetes bacterium]|nr:SDR family oxidoreductase [Bacteroidota bacterium]